jgi:hypothetical protein
MAGVGAPLPAMGSSPERGKRGKEEGERGAQLGGMAWGGEGCRRGYRRGGSPLLLLRAVREKEPDVRKKRRKERRKRKGRKRKERKRKKYGKFSKLEIF